MDSYFEIKAIPDPELLQSAIVAQLMQALHGLLPAYEGRVGISFPAYGQARALGGILRLHGTSEDMQRLLDQAHDDSVLSNYALITDVLMVPEKVKGYALYRRRHVKGESDIRRLVKRHKARGTWTAELEEAIFAKYRQPRNCPHVTLKSYTTRQAKFMLFIEQEMQGKAVEGEFNAYGLSKGSTVPWF
ncbi:type I-F CRISPR-associated endoribonuclease Cas6/Csy4 [Amphritea pacifica]|uniref:type I-F CRISPR-associated endoribonuclease Cas6/Csy4 n=1 Tax=Amphritea pacifica TaxID=2811233 RepID=UPI0019655A91|nr:type I-F CRISPR-associated endoribonuclease Cas6/Csy4 [Amphritea pacifica]MBN1007481.1 type I-F CRISPR-associated endoribonuclease Cas6/Csy4 [Amphritea pacifica]